MVNRANPERYNLESVTRVAAVLNALDQAGASSLDQIARSCSFSESTALRYVSSLVNQGFVERDQKTGAYRLGLKLFSLGSSAMRQRDVVGSMRATLETVHEKFGETVNLAVLQQDQVMIVHTVESAQSARKGTDVGGVDPWHATSLGKALLSAMAAGGRDSLLDGLTLRAYTPNTLTDRAALEHDLEAIRARGYSIDDEEFLEGLRCVGVAVRDHAGDARYAISVSGPKSRMSFGQMHGIGEFLKSASEELAHGVVHAG